ncbi:MAG: hypothetical protein AAFX50_01615 [Acidobacteriota bacterium]
MTGRSPDRAGGPAPPPKPPWLALGSGLFIISFLVLMLGSVWRDHTDLKRELDGLRAKVQAFESPRVGTVLELAPAPGRSENDESATGDAPALDADGVATLILRPADPVPRRPFQLTIIGGDGRRWSLEGEAGASGAVSVTLGPTALGPGRARFELLGGPTGDADAAPAERFELEVTVAP